MKLAWTVLFSLLCVSILGQSGSLPDLPDGDPGRLDFRAAEWRNPASQPVEWATVREFLESSAANQHAYVEGVFDCKNYAFALYREAQQRGIQCCLAVIRYEQRPGHCVVGFPTTDKGEVFVDFTPIVSANDKQHQAKGVVLVMPGFPFIHIPLEQIPTDFTNSPPTFLRYIDLQKQLAEAGKKLEKERRALDVMQVELESLKAQAARNSQNHLQLQVEKAQADYEEACRAYEARKAVYLNFLEATKSPYSTTELPVVRGVSRL